MFGTYFKKMYKQLKGIGALSVFIELSVFIDLIFHESPLITHLSHVQLILTKFDIVQNSKHDSLFYEPSEHRCMIEKLLYFDLDTLHCNH